MGLVSGWIEYSTDAYRGEEYVYIYCESQCTFWLRGKGME